ncbi:MAG: zinc ribbon domain-containing protein [Bacteroidales bacterium]|nr:zinc ribbon domain-containing protein [Bacteroidales bacterium]
METNEREQVRVRADEQMQKAVKPNANVNGNVGSGDCPYCGATVEADYEICPACGHRLVEYCTFCGASMTAIDIDCPECGMPSDGVTCPDCGALNFRSFCRQCNRPLSRAARKAVEKAKADPKVQEAVSILVKMAELEAEMQNATDDDGTPDDTPHEPTEKELRLRQLMGKVGFKPSEKPKAQPKQSSSRSREEIQAEYQRMVEEANKVLESMVPPAGSTPQEQRNYSTARKVAVMETYKEKVTVSYISQQIERMGWVCNRCQVFHRSPEECLVREYGGYWTTRTVDVWSTREEEVEKPRKVYKRID